MRTPLEKIEIMSIYRLGGELVHLPKRMAKTTPDMHLALEQIAKDVKEAGGRLLLSDLFRSYDMQLQAHLDWKTGKKRAYSPAPGGSMHEAGRAFDLSLQDINMKLSKFWEIAAKYGVVPIIDKPKKKKSEAWHFECRGSHIAVYDYYKAKKSPNMKPYKAMVLSAILSIQVHVDRFRKRQNGAYIQAALIRLGEDVGNIDGIIGKNTKTILASLGIEGLEESEILIKIEELLNEKYPNEYIMQVEEEDALFDYEAPEHIMEEETPIVEVEDELLKDETLEDESPKDESPKDESSVE